MDSARVAPGVAIDAEGLIALRAVAARPGGAGRAASDLPGGVVARRRGRGLETADIRAYVPGDDARHVDRNVTARTGALHVRAFHEERDRRMLLLADFRPAMLWGTRRALRSVVAAEALAIAAWRGARAGARVGLFAFGAGAPIYVEPRARERGALDVIGGLVAAHDAALRAALAGSEADGGALDDAVALARRIAGARASLVLASALDAPGAELPVLVRAAAEGPGFAVLRIVDAFERDAPSGRYLFRTQRGAAVRPVDLDAPAESAGDGVAAALRRLGADVAEIDSRWDADRVALELDGIDGRG